MAVKVADTLKPMGNFPIAEAMDVAFGDGESLQKKLDDGTLGGGGDKIQYDIMPNATAELSGKIIQFTGDTGTYVSGAFYKCVEKEGSFAWEKVSSDSYDDTEIREEIEKKAEIDDSDKESTTTTLSAKAISDSLVDLENEVGNVYSTEETVCGKWIDGKKIYRKVLLCATDTTLNAGGDWTVVSGWSETPSDIKEFVRIDTSNVSLGNRIDYSIQANKTLKFYSLASYLLVKVGDKLILEYTKTTD